MSSVTSAVRVAAVALVVSLSSMDCVKAADGFPFGMEMTLDAARLPGSKLILSNDSTGDEEGDQKDDSGMIETLAKELKGQRWDADKSVWK